LIGEHISVKRIKLNFTHYLPEAYCISDLVIWVSWPVI